MPSSVVEWFWICFCWLWQRVNCRWLVRKKVVWCVCVCVSMSCKNIRLLCDVFDIFEQALISKTVEPCKKNVGSLRICYYCLGWQTPAGGHSVCFDCVVGVCSYLLPITCELESIGSSVDWEVLARAIPLDVRFCFDSHSVASQSPCFTLASSRSTTTL